MSDDGEEFSLLVELRCTYCHEIFGAVVDITMMDEVFQEHLKTCPSKTPFERKYNL